MSESVPLICQISFDNLGLHQIEGLVESENTNCEGVMKKLNIRKEVLMKDCEIKNGKYTSMDIDSKSKIE